MKLPSAYNTMQLLGMLEEALQKEQTEWKPYSYSSMQIDEVTGTARNDIVQWLAQLNRHFKFYPETFYLSTAMLDKVLHSVKARPKYLRCIGIACFYLAAKTLEEDEMVPSTLKFVQQSGCGCSVAEVLRMERRLLDILSWDLRFITPLDFLHIFHASLLSSLPHLLDSTANMTPAKHLSLLTRKLQAIVSFHGALQFSPSVLALSVISQELQQFLPQWFAVTSIIQRHTQISDEDLIRCSDLVSHVLSQSVLPIKANNIKCKKRHKSGTPTKKRKVAEPEEDDIYDCIKRLYSEENTEAITVISLASCGSEMRQEDPVSMALVPLQAAVN